jgi:hypothetical protein
LKWTNGYVIQHEVDFDAVDENSMYISFVVSAEQLILEILLMTELGLRLKDKFVNDRTGIKQNGTSGCCSVFLSTLTCKDTRLTKI